MPPDSRVNTGSREADCTLCTHFYLTWRTPHTHGCRAYAFEAPTYPTIVVQRESGRPCELFEPRENSDSGRREGRGEAPGDSPGQFS